MFINIVTSILRKTLIVGMAILLVAGSLGSASFAAVSASSNMAPNDTFQSYLPIALNDTSSRYVLLGVYPHGDVTNQGVMDAELHGLDAWVNPGAQISIVGIFSTFEGNHDYVFQQLEKLWINGYTCFNNVESTHTSSQIANGAIDNQIRNFANVFKDWAAQGGGRFAYLAPLQEMNGNWVVYGMDPTNFKRAFAHIRQIFAEQGVPANSVRWVFAPNGWSKKGTPGFESYYPGDASVDIVSFSGYNFGFNPASPSQDWQPPIEVYNNPNFPSPEGWYLDRMRAMAPTKPIFISQTGTSAYFSTGESTPRKDKWLSDAYAYLASYPGVRAVIYFNLVNQQGIDWPFYVPGDPAHQYQGYRDAVTAPWFQYISPQELSQIYLTP